MYCPACGENNREGSSYCRKCGQRLATESTPRYPRAVEQPRKPKKGMPRPIIIVIACAVLVAISAGVYLIISGDGPQSSSTNSTTAPSQTSQAVEKSDEPTQTNSEPGASDGNSDDADDAASRDAEAERERKQAAEEKRATEEKRAAEEAARQEAEQQRAAAEAAQEEAARQERAAALHVQTLYYSFDLPDDLYGKVDIQIGNSTVDVYGTELTECASTPILSVSAINEAETDDLWNTNNSVVTKLNPTAVVAYSIREETNIRATPFSDRDLWLSLHDECVNGLKSTIQVHYGDLGE